MNENQASSRANESFEQMMAIAEFAAKGHSERRQVVFRVFASYMTLLVIIAGLIMKHWKDEMIHSWEVAIPVSVFLLIFMGVYWRWLYWIYGALIYDVRRRDFFLKKAEILCFYHSKFLKFKFRDPSEYGKSSLNLAVGRSRTVTEEEMFEMSKPDVPVPTKHESDPNKLYVFCDMHFWFNLAGPLGLTVLITTALVSRITATHNFLVWIANALF